MKPLTKNLWRQIKASRGRFIAIIMIILMGCLIFVGIKAIGPGLNDSAQTVLKQQRLSDVQVISNQGFTAKDVAAAKKVSGAQVEAVAFKYVLGSRQKDVVALYGYQKAQRQNQLILKSGRLPKANNEILLDQRAKTENHYKLGQTYTFNKSAGLKRQTYKIVGFANSPMYIDNTLRGASNIGSGSVQYFAYIPQNQLNLPVATMLTIRFPKLQNKGTFTDTYKNAVAGKITALKKVMQTRGLTRRQEIIQQGEQQLKRQQQQMTQTGYLNNPAALQQGLQQGHAGQQLAQAQAKLQKTPVPTYTWQTRSDLPGFSAYGESSDRIAAIANVFPVFFFLIAALITFTTITRMVAEARIQIGTLKAMGFSRHEIARNYYIYAILAGFIGAILGVIIGSETLPRFVISIYGLYIFHDPVILPQWGPIILAILVSLLTTIGAATIATGQELREKPAALMLPKAPRSAKRILLERIKPLWQHLNFNQKVSYRNLFRFKSRMIMTIIGIAGGTALILTGFGISNSITASGTNQFNDIFHYQAIVQSVSQTKVPHTQAVLQKNPDYQRDTLAATRVVTAKSGGKQVDEVNVYTPKTPSDFQHFISLRTLKNNQPITLPKTGAVVTRKLAKLLKVQAGSSITLTIPNGQPIKVKVAAVTQNYVSHFIYLSPQAYEQIFKAQPVYQTLLVRLKAQNKTARNTLANQLLKDGNTLGVSYVSDQEQGISDMSGQLNYVIAILVVLSGLLSFVVLYNLVNINVSERLRELSTLKVLGFFDNEVTMYIMRENVVLAIVGIVLGYGLGNLLTAYILNQAETPTVIFPLTIHWPGYVIATILMLVFIAIVMWFTHRHLQKIDMIDALSANE